MAPRKKPSAEPSRRSTRTAAESTLAQNSSAKKRGNDAVEEATAATAAMDNTGPSEPKKAKKHLGVGDKLPDLTLLDEEGNLVRIHDIAFDRGFILFAYPRASTPGCTKQVKPPLLLRKPIFFIAFC